MIIYRELRWGDAFSYGPKNVLRLDKDQLTQIVGKNGHGKSSIGLLLEEVQFNQNSKKIKKANVLNRYTKSKTYFIELDFDKDNDHYTISTNRSANTGTIKFTRNGIDISSHTATGTYKTIENTLFECMLNLHYIQKSEIKQITVKSAKLFSEQTDFISLQFDFTDGCFANIKLIEKPSEPSKTIQIYQNAEIISIDLVKMSICKTTRTSNGITVNETNVAGIDIVDKKIGHFLHPENGTKNQANSILDKFLAKEQSNKIIKKINSLNE